MSSRNAIEAGQEYAPCANRPDDQPRIRVAATPDPDWHKADIVTVRPDGTTSNPRRIEVSQLHPTGTTRDGNPRKTGYRLVQHADGTPADVGEAR